MGGPSNFYSYLWLRKNGTPYYAGKGSGIRGFYSRSHGVHAPPDKSRIVIFHMDSESLAFESEKALIELFGRKNNGSGILRNLTDGGEGASGFIYSEDMRKKRSESYAKHCRSLASARIGIPLSEEHKRKVSAGLRGKSRPPLSNEQKLKISKARSGKCIGHLNPFWGHSHTSSAIKAISKTWFKSGSVPWNKGIKGIPWSKARRAAQERRKAAV